MRNLVVFMHISLDGFTARVDGAMNWIKVSNEMFEYANARTQAADTALYGRKTFEMMDAYWPTAGDKSNASKHDIEHSTWYNKTLKYVVSETAEQQNTDKIKFIGGDIKAQVLNLKKQDGGEIIMFGSPGLARFLMKEGLIDEFWLFVNPIVLGAGIPLFPNTEIKLRLEKSNAFPDGVIGLHYLKE
ncbi:dihydrofolate reductase family protein [Mucilaginibacter rubeus]|uniref:Dihydrofolate reductase n=1 Tax=Mucilaginibacter rubeus TaxID=2027860 RepID=A0A5C1I242_9SPHI|nr:dihydrofolate reductase family protein [Mucilaginibacter rubeus]QEM11271.1 dihydrofolate reductase [Mucilaginibacter rubeus]